MKRHIAVLAVLLGFLATAASAERINDAMAANVADVEGKVMQLAEAIPAGKYGWAPADGVRTVSETLMHIAGANYFFAMRMGGPKPPDDVRDWEKTVTEKADAVAKVKTSFEVVKKALAGAKLDEPTKLFGGKEGTIADFALIAVGHGHEHLGQLIAYARSMGVVPPWSQ